jgi:hypothetical protein
METRYAVLGLVSVVTFVMAVRGIVAIMEGDFGTFGRQAGVGGIVFAFGIGLFRHWDELG